MGFARRKRRKFKGIFFAIGIIICIAVISGLVIYLVDYKVSHMEANYLSQIESLELNSYLNQKEVYTPINIIKSGTLITEDLLNKSIILSSLSQDSYFSSEDIGTFAIINLPANQPIMNSMITTENLANDIRVQEFSIFDLPSTLAVNEYIDIRINFPNGEDYIVLSKKKVREMNSETGTIWLWLSEKELLEISSAVVDAYIHEGTKLYTTLYVEPSIQEAAITNYPANTHVLTLMEEDPNILELATTALMAEARFYLEERLSGVNPIIEWTDSKEEVPDEVTTDENISIDQEESISNSGTVIEESAEAIATDVQEEGEISNDGFFD